MIGPFLLASLHRSAIFRYEKNTVLINAWVRQSDKILCGPLVQSINKLHIPLGKVPQYAKCHEITNLPLSTINTTLRQHFVREDGLQCLDGLVPHPGSWIRLHLFSSQDFSLVKVFSKVRDYWVHSDAAHCYHSVIFEMIGEELWVRQWSMNFYGACSSVTLKNYIILVKFTSIIIHLCILLHIHC